MVRQAWRAVGSGSCDAEGVVRVTLNASRPGVLEHVTTQPVAAEALAPAPLEPSVSVSKSITRRRQDDDVKEDRSLIRLRAMERIDKAFAALDDVLDDPTTS